MNIYLINWVYGDGWHLSGVVIASNEKEALELLNLSSDETDIKIVKIGHCIKIMPSQLVCKEQL